MRGKRPDMTERLSQLKRDIEQKRQKLLKKERLKKEREQECLKKSLAEWKKYPWNEVSKLVNQIPMGTVIEFNTEHTSRSSGEKLESHTTIHLSPDSNVQIRVTMAKSNFLFDDYHSPFGTDGFQENLFNRLAAIGFDAPAVWLTDLKRAIQLVSEKHREYIEACRFWDEDFWGKNWVDLLDYLRQTGKGSQSIVLSSQKHKDGCETTVSLRFNPVEGRPPYVKSFFYSPRNDARRVAESTSESNMSLMAYRQSECKTAEDVEKLMDKILSLVEDHFTK